MRFGKVNKLPVKRFIKIAEISEHIPLILLLQTFNAIKTNLRIN